MSNSNKNGNAEILNGNNLHRVVRYQEELANAIRKAQVEDYFRNRVEQELERAYNEDAIDVDIQIGNGQKLSIPEDLYPLVKTEAVKILNTLLDRAEEERKNAGDKLARLYSQRPELYDEEGFLTENVAINHNQN